MPIHTAYRQMPEVGPLVYLPGLQRHFALGAHLVAKLEFGGPTSNIYARVCAGMLQLAAARGDIQPGCTITETASGPFAFAFAVQCTLFGYKPVLCMPAGAAGEETTRLENAGAKLVFTLADGGWGEAAARAQDIAQQTGGYFMNYTNNDDNLEVHRRTTGPEIYESAAGEVDIFVAGVGSGGTLCGTAEFLKGWAGNIKAVGVQPLESQVLTGGFSARHGVQGIGLPFIPGNYNPYIVDEVLSVSTGEAKQLAQLAFELDGVPCDIASGAALAAAVTLAARQENAGKRIITLLSAKRTFA